jgi:hypothetical protein
VELVPFPNRLEPECFRRFAAGPYLAKTFTLFGIRPSQYNSLLVFGPAPHDSRLERPERIIPREARTFHADCAAVLFAAAFRSLKRVEKGPAEIQ